MGNAFGGGIQPAAPIAPAAVAAEKRLTKMRIRSLKDQVGQAKLENRALALQYELRRQETSGIRRLRA
jgi:hypothetical protein